MMTRAARDVLAERRRQVTAEGFSVAHDDAHADLSLGMAAALYAAPRDDLKIASFDDNGVRLADPWPWSKRWDKRQAHKRRKRLVIAGALILAEVERLDRLQEGWRRGNLWRPGWRNAMARRWYGCSDWLAYLFVDHYGRVPRPPANLFKKK